ncbi:hypothetical protein OCGS_0758 [Oceaniovalibus guishaninsula JLT2003]|uniref:Uncharacterized protein n=1 Tax=Oceaniovalibus guishaninsula JLT2003 TaxID=1231392 RepID=K2HC63_9RHOB|nr:hypothetical protein OCGS_0758 [Oceaniovalibus guishaninsula JLT2003]
MGNAPSSATGAAPRAVGAEGSKSWRAFIVSFPEYVRSKNERIPNPSLHN